jgi:hypothetical protein
MSDDDDVEVDGVFAELPDVTRRPRAVEKRTVDAAYPSQFLSDDGRRAERFEQEPVQITEVRRLSIRSKDTLATDALRNDESRGLQAIGFALDASPIEAELTCEVGQRGRLVRLEIDAREETRLRL